MNKITPYFLSCKRIELFEETFKSFWINCLDLELIDRFIVIDDNSNIKDRNRIIELMNTIQLPSLFVCKNNIKGQASSLNIFYDLCKTKYAIAIEDDWKFIRSGHFLKDSLEIMNIYPYVKRVCLDLSSSGKSISDIESDIFSINNEKYFIHEYKNKNEWPSFTFRQCVVDVEDCFKNIGYVNSKPEFSHDGSRPTAETDYAVRYCHFGYRTAFFLNTFVQEMSKNYPSSFELNKTNRYLEI